MNVFKLSGLYLTLLGLLSLGIPASAVTTQDVAGLAGYSETAAPETIGLIAEGEDEEDTGCDEAAGDICAPDDGPPVIND